MKIDQNTFASACYEMNNIKELIEALNNSVYPTDCAEWAITPQEYKEQIRRALLAKMLE